MTRINSLAINVLAAAATLACIGTASATENSYNPNAYILLNGSAVKPDSKYPEDKTGWGGGVKVGIPLNPSWDLQIGGNYAVSTDHGANVHQTMAGVDALYLFTPAGFRPFVLVGAGATRDKFADPAVGRFQRTSPYVNAGLGFQYKITPTLGMQADVREVGSFYRKRVEEYGVKNTANTYVNVGLTWAFGGPPPAPVVPVTTSTRTQETTVETTPAPAPIVAPPPPPPAPVMKKYTLSASELFGFNSAKLGPNQPKLDEVAATMNGNSDIANVTIVGYTDRIGSTAYNQKLSEQRANSVKTYLQGKGVAESRLTAVGKGEADPVVECKDEKKRPALIKCLEPNRRVEIEPVTFTKQVN
jgi:OOP family OmpA-OmpF porin